MRPVVDALFESLCNVWVLMKCVDLMNSSSFYASLGN